MKKRIVLLTHGWGLGLDSLSALVQALHNANETYCSETVWLGVDSGYQIGKGLSAGLYGWRDGAWRSLDASPSNTCQDMDKKTLPLVCLGHSLGFAKLLMWLAPPISLDPPTRLASSLAQWLQPLPRQCTGLVSLHGFGRFCAQTKGQSGTPQRLLERMIRQFQSHPDQVLRDFLGRAANQPSCSHANNRIPPLGPASKQLLGADLELMRHVNFSSPAGLPILWIRALVDSIVPQALIEDLATECGSPTSKIAELGTHHLSPLSEPSLYTERLFEFIDRCTASNSQPL